MVSRKFQLDQRVVHHGNRCLERLGNLQHWRYSEDAWTRPQGSQKVRKMEMKINQYSKELHEEGEILALTSRSPLKAVEGAEWQARMVRRGLKTLLDSWLHQIRLYKQVTVFVHPNWSLFTKLSAKSKDWLNFNLSFPCLVGCLWCLGQFPK